MGIASVWTAQLDARWCERRLLVGNPLLLRLRMDDENPCKRYGSNGLDPSRTFQPPVSGSLWLTPVHNIRSIHRVDQSEIVQSTPSCTLHWLSMTYDSAPTDRATRTVANSLLSWFKTWMKAMIRHAVALPLHTIFAYFLFPCPLLATVPVRLCPTPWLPIAIAYSTPSWISPICRTSPSGTPRNIDGLRSTF